MMEKAAKGNRCKDCSYAVNCINGSWCSKLKIYTERSKVCPCQLGKGETKQT